MYRVLFLLKSRRITQASIALCIRKAERTVRNKLAGRQDFTVKEARAIRDCFFPEETLDALFEEV